MKSTLALIALTAACLTAHAALSDAEKEGARVQSQLDAIDKDRAQRLQSAGQAQTTSSTPTTSTPWEGLLALAGVVALVVVFRKPK